MKEKYRKLIPAVFVLALGLRLVLACTARGFTTDIACFYGWAKRVFEGGFTNFYAEGTFSDYPPGYIYVLYPVGALLKLLRVTYLSPGCLLLVKLPAILCDMGMGAVIYRAARRRFSGEKACLFAALYLFNPAVLQNSVIWGQVDAVYTLAVIFMCRLLEKKKTIPAYFVYAAGVLLKPQTIIFTPLLLLGIYENVLAGNAWKRNKQKFFRNLAGGLAAIGCMAAACLPFGIERIIKLYISTMGSYQYVSVNAYNFWAMLELNWVSQDTKLLGFLPCSMIGTLVILAICILSVIIFLRRKDSADRYYVTGAFIIMTMFLFSVRMHERYLFPVMVFLLLAFLADGQSCFLLAYGVISVLHFLNVWHVLTYYKPGSYDAGSLFVVGLSFCMTVAGAYLYHGIRMTEKKTEGAPLSPREARREARRQAAQAGAQTTAPAQAGTRPPLVLKDALYMAGITVFYAFFAFNGLGSRLVPQTVYQTKPGENLMLRLPQNERVASVSCYLGYEHDVTMGAWVWNEETQSWEALQELTFKNVYSWNTVKLDVPTGGILCLIADGSERAVSELVFCNEEGAVITPLNKSDFPNLFDEAGYYPQEAGYLYSSYFDEIYYTRTAHEMLNGLTTYEWTHPPFGKILISLGVLLFGENPFGFRFMGAFLGCLMLPFVYLLGRNLCKSREAGLFAASLFAFDFMHFTQTRITTIDVFITFFVILMYFFMQAYTEHNFLKEPLRKTFLPLGACGVAFGFGIASKWTGFYAGAGLALLFFTVCAERYLESRTQDVKLFWNRFWKTCLFCVVFFIVIPACIYLLSYLPFRGSDPDMGLIARMWKNQGSMLGYHSGVTATHPYASSWYEWPTMLRPILYYSADAGGALASGISAFGNPLVWWAGIAAFVILGYRAVRKRDKTAAFLCVAYLAQYLPWCFVSRCTFIYHYFPAVPFVVLMNTYLISSMKITKKKRNRIFLVYGAAAFALFLWFYPVLSGAAINRSFAKEALRWLNGWVLVI